MRTTILTLTLFLISLTTLSAQWEILNEGFKGSINTIDFVNDNIGWIAGSDGTLLKTSDGGENWNSIDIANSLNFYQIDFINESIGWAIEESSIRKSIDGGLSWIQQFPNYGFGSLYVLDENNVYIVGGDTIFKTTNGGTNWIDISPNLPNRNYNSLWFKDSQTGVVVGNYNDGTRDRGIILRTTNGGSIWNEVIVNEFNSIYDLQFLNNSISYFRANNDSITFLCKTVDMCSSWTIKTQSSYGIGSYQYIDSNTVYAIIGDSITANNIMKSLNSGITWQTVQSTPFWLTRIYFVNSFKGFILSDWFLLAINSGNTNWIIKKFFYPSINDVLFTDKCHGVFIGGFMSSGRGAHGGGPVGNIFTTENGGISWNINFYNVDRILHSASYVSNTLGFCFGTYVQGPDRIYKTTDSGTNWIQMIEFSQDSIGYGFGVSDLIFNNEQDGWAVGSYWGTMEGAGIIKTTDSGEHWDLDWIDTTIGSPGLKSIVCNVVTGWAVGESGMLIKYTPQTGWIKQTSITDLPLKKVFFSDENHGWITGGYQNANNFQNIVLKTTNGGDSWEKVQNVPYLIKDIVFLDNNFGWAIGYDSSGVGGILKTTDGGNTWTIDTDNLSAKLNALYIKDGYGWAVGDNGLILRTTNAGPTWVDDENETLPTEFTLEQNYPNPFNPSTKIKFTIPTPPSSSPLPKGRNEVGFVTLKVYDVLGREIATLVNEEKKPGIYEIEFNGTELSSGIYLYRLIAGNLMAVRKAIVLK
jgi:photosystem II stability/assembly factor-like uncharacterized protein